MKVIQIGVGGFGRHWVNMLSEYPGVEIVAQVDVSQEQLDIAAEICGISSKHQYADLDEALAVEKADLLICVSPSGFHLDHTTKAMKAGLDVIVEKPLADNIEDALAIADVAMETGQLVAVSQNYRYRPEIWAMRRLIENGDIGAIGQIHIEFFKGWHFGEDNYRQTMEDVLLVDMAIHHFDLIRFITGQNAISVRGESWNPPWSDNTGDTSIALTFTLENQARFTYNGSWCSQGDFADWNGNWLIDGEKGSITYSHGDVTLNLAPEKYRVDESRKVTFQGPPILNQAYVFTDMMASRIEGRQPKTSVFDNINSISMVFAAQEAVRSGSRVAVQSQ